MRWTLVAGLMVLAGVCAAPAFADDAALVKTWNVQRRALTAPFERFDRALRAAPEGGRPVRTLLRAWEPTRIAARQLAGALRRVEAAVTAQSSSTPDGARARRLLVHGLRDLREGIALFDAAFELMAWTVQARSKPLARARTRAAKAVMRASGRELATGFGELGAAAQLLRPLEPGAPPPNTAPAPR